MKKTHKDANVQSVDRSLQKIAVDSRDYISSLNTAVLYIGARNVSESQLPESVRDEIRNADFKILISFFQP